MAALPPCRGQAVMLTPEFRVLSNLLAGAVGAFSLPPSFQGLMLMFSRGEASPRETSTFPRRESGPGAGRLFKASEKPEQIA